MTEHKCIVS